MITLRPYQQAAVDQLRREISAGGEFMFKAPIGSGRTIMVASAMQAAKRPAFTSRQRLILDQAKRICEGLGGLQHAEFVLFLGKVTDLTGYDVVYAFADLREIGIDAPCVIREEPAGA